MAAGQIYKGKNVRFSFDGKTLYHATSCKLSISTKLEEIATKDTDGTVSTPSNYAWSISTEALVADKPVSSMQSDFMDIMDLQLAGTEINIEFTDSNDGGFILSGKVYVESSDITAEVGNSVTGSFSFKGNGNLNKTASAPVVVDVPYITSGGSAYIFSGVAFEYQIYATNTPTSYSVTGLPDGLVINMATGLITGTPTTGTMNMTVHATNAGGTGDQLVVNVALDGLPPTAPNNLTASNIQATQFNLNFNGSTFNGGFVGDNIERYEVYRNGVYLQYIASGGAVSTLIQIQTSGVTNLWKLRAKDVTGVYSAFSAELSVTQA
jgi:hypothetical protein